MSDERFEDLSRSLDRPLQSQPLFAAEDLHNPDTSWLIVCNPLVAVVAQQDGLTTANDREHRAVQGFLAAQMASAKSASVRSNAQLRSHVGMLEGGARVAGPSLCEAISS